MENKIGFEDVLRMKCEQTDWRLEKLKNRSRDV